MPQKIIIAADELFVCPKCRHHFSLDLGITRQTIERYESAFEEAFAAQRKEMEGVMARKSIGSDSNDSSRQAVEAILLKSDPSQRLPTSRS